MRKYVSFVQILRRKWFGLKSFQIWSDCWIIRNNFNSEGIFNQSQPYFQNKTLSGLKIKISWLLKTNCAKEFKNSEKCLKDKASNKWKLLSTNVNIITECLLCKRKMCQLDASRRIEIRDQVTNADTVCNRTQAQLTQINNFSNSLQSFFLQSKCPFHLVLISTLQSISFNSGWILYFLALLIQHTCRIHSFWFGIFSTRGADKSNMGGNIDVFLSLSLILNKLRSLIRSRFKRLEV